MEQHIRLRVHTIECTCVHTMAGSSLLVNVAVYLSLKRCPKLIWMAAH